MIFFTVSPEAAITTPINQTYSLGDTAMLVCTSMGGPDNTYQWLVNGSDISGETSGTLMFTTMTAADGGVYTCLVSNTAGSDTASTYVFIAPYFTTPPIDIMQPMGSSGSLSCVAEAFPDPEYQWERVDGEPIRADIVTRQSTLLLSSIMFGDEGEYSCYVTSREMTIQSQRATIHGKMKAME